MIKRSFLAEFGVIGTALIFSVTIFAPLIAPYDPTLQSPNRLAPPSRQHLLGTDKYGRDVFSRLVYGTRVSFIIGICSVFFSSIAGGLLGVLAGYKGGFWDRTICWMADLMLSFPSVLVGVISLVILGPGTYKVIIAISIAFTPRFIRLARGGTLAIKEDDFVHAARAIGASHWRILFYHILPNISGSIIVMSTVWAASAIRLESALSFLGLGAQPPTPSWGLMLREGLENILFSQWNAFFSGLAIFISIMMLNFLGDSLRDYLDPKMRGGTYG